MNRRNFIASAIAACAAPVVPMPVLKPRALGASTMAFDLAKGGSGVSTLYCWIVDPETRLMKLHHYEVTGGESIKLIS